jgi:hypothetical protein
VVEELVGVGVVLELEVGVAGEGMVESASDSGCDSGSGIDGRSGPGQTALDVGCHLADQTALDVGYHRASY